MEHAVVCAHGNKPIVQAAVAVKVVDDFGLRVNDVAEEPVSLGQRSRVIL